MINVTRSSMPELDEYIDEIKSLWDSHWLTNMGCKHNELEAQLSDYLDADNLMLTVNGHMALEIAIQALGLTGEVITTPFTFVSTTNAIIRCGLTPVFCDINPIDYTIDVNKLEALITENTSAILPVHVYGNVCNIEEIDRIARKHNLKVIYDAAHTFGVKYKGKGMAAYGDAVCYSFHATKVFNTIEGGAVCFKDAILKDKIHELRDFGIVDEETIIEPGGNAKMNEFAAAMGLCNLRHVDSEIQKRNIVVEKYRELLIGIHGIRLTAVQQDTVSNSAYFPICVNPMEYGMTRDELHERLKSNGIGSRKYFYPLTNELVFTKGKYYGDTPVARCVSESILTLPLYSDLEIENIEKICRIIQH